MSEFSFRTCPLCQGYGVLDSGRNCTKCGGHGWGGLNGPGMIGCGDIIIENSTGDEISHAEFTRRVLARNQTTLELKT